MMKNKYYKSAYIDLHYYIIFLKLQVALLHLQMVMAMCILRQLLMLFARLSAFEKHLKDNVLLSQWRCEDWGAALHGPIRFTKTKARNILL